MLSTISLAPQPKSQHRWFLRVQPESPHGSIETFVELFKDFAALGDAGAFAAADSDGSNCTMRIIKQQKERNSVELVVEVAQCDFRYPRPLRNAVFALGEMLESTPVEFRVESLTQSPSNMVIETQVDPAEVLAGRFYPEISIRLGVRVQTRIPPNYRSGRRIWLSGEGALSIQLVKDMIKLADRWASVLAGAYPSSEEELQNGESMVLGAQGCQHDEMTFEVLVDRFIAAEPAFWPLLNLLIIRARRSTVISTVVLE